MFRNLIVSVTCRYFSQEI